MVACSGCSEKVERQNPSYLIKATTENIESIRSGSFFDVHCPNCKTTTKHPYPFVITDDKNYVIKYYGKGVSNDRFRELGLSDLSKKTYESIAKRRYDNAEQIRRSWVNDLLELNERIIEFSDPLFNIRYRNAIKKKLFMPNRNKYSLMSLVHNEVDDLRGDFIINKWHLFDHKDNNFIYKNAKTGETKLLAEETYKKWRADMDRKINEDKLREKKFHLAIAPFAIIGILMLIYIVIIMILKAFGL